MPRSEIFASVSAHGRRCINGFGAGGIKGHSDQILKRLIISPDGKQGLLQVRQDARVYAGLFDGDEHATLTLADNRHAYVHVARGRIELNGQLLREGDGVRLRKEQVIELSNGRDAEVLVFDLRPNELPRMP
ncbi:Quercetin 2,3-dioxygenase [compost metagenome]